MAAFYHIFLELPQMIRGVGRRQSMEGLKLGTTIKILKHLGAQRGGGAQKNEILKCWYDWSPSANFVPTPLMVGLIPYFGFWRHVQNHNKSGQYKNYGGAFLYSINPKLHKDTPLFF